MTKLFLVLCAVIMLSGLAMMFAGAPLWLCVWIASYEYGFIGFLIWIVMGPGSRMSVPRAIFLWWPALMMNKPGWLVVRGHRKT